MSAIVSESEYSDILNEFEASSDSSNESNFLGILFLLKAFMKLPFFIVENTESFSMWSSEPQISSSRTKRKDIICHKPGPTIYSKINSGTKFNLFISMLPDNAIFDITRFTNENLAKKNLKIEKITESDLLNFIGLCIVSGTYKTGMENLDMLYDSELGIPIFQKTMPKYKFEIIAANITFSSQSSRSERYHSKKNDKLIYIRDFFEAFRQKAKLFYKPSTNLTVDEQLVPFRGRVNFKQYIPMKPSKYGIKIFLLCDSFTYYVYNADIYLGKNYNNESNAKNIGENTVMRLMEGFDLPGLNITMDNFFTSISLAKRLLEKNITLVGTVRKNRKHIPKFNRMNLYDSEYFFSGNLTILNYQTKRNKNVILLSTFHNFPSTENDNKKTPEIILYYNSTKGGVDTCDLMVRNYSVKRKTKRWPTTIFYNLIDIICLNCYVVYRELHPEDMEKESSRAKFLIDLAKEIFLNASTLGNEKTKNKKKKTEKGRCVKCPRSKDNKLTRFCQNCQSFICKLHSENVIQCTDCKK